MEYRRVAQTTDLADSFQPPLTGTVNDLFCKFIAQPHEPQVMFAILMLHRLRLI
jgi:hypothetical protein